MDAINTWGHPLLKGARGIGLFIGLDLNTEGLQKSGAWNPDSGTASIWLVKELMNAGMLAIAAGPSVVRLLPPLNVSEDEVKTALSILRRVLDKA
jgi:4-aminobutyrate aminotransferase-like enzyme